jgi:hypothetical protein
MIPTLAWYDLNTCEFKSDYLFNPEQHQPGKKISSLNKGIQVGVNRS